jgi:hypothetical protein
MKKNIKTSKLPLRTETVRMLSAQELSSVAGGVIQTLTQPSAARCTVSCEATLAHG